MNATNPIYQSITNEQKSLAPIICKSLIVVATVIGLAAAVFFSGHALMGFIAAGAAAWQIGLVSVGCVLSSSALLGVGFFATQHRMFEDTKDNLKDSAQFFLKTLATPYYAVRAGIDYFK